MKYGDIELFESKIYNLQIESLTEDPDFSLSEESRIYYNIESKNYRMNNGTEYIDFSLPDNFMNLINTLGSNWVNSTTFGFNPTDFNNLNTISGLTSNSTLFNVLSQFDTAIHNLDVPEFSNLEDVIIPDDIADGYLLYYSDGTYTFSSIDDLISNYANLTTQNIKDINTTEVTNGNSLLYDSTANQFVTFSTSIIIDDLFEDTIHTITHNLGKKYLAVTVIDAQSDQIIPNSNIQYLDQTSLLITLSTAAKIKVILTVPYDQ